MTDASIKDANSSVSSPDQDAVHPAFQKLRSEHIPSLNITIEEYEHAATGALHYHLRSESPENVFLVAFRTMPMDSTGVAHILEHTALCGSEKFPVRDPFFMMIRRSLNTFMNAFTSSDWTAYPFASKNRKDFANLLSVYLDAAFFSRLHELDFAQEGHRLEFSEPENPDSELQYKGVVYNEMKGAMSSTNSILWQMMTKHLFPSTTYHYNSGGEPEDIPKLSYQQLLNFYKTHYHPSNSVFMTFGNMSAFDHHQQLEELALSSFQRLDSDIRVDDEERYQAPIKVEEFYAVEAPAENKTHVVVGWLLGKSTNLKELFQAQLLSSVLLENSASPLLYALETSDLGQSPSPMCGLEDSNREMTFMAGLEACNADATETVEALILETLQQLVENGVDQDQVEAALHQLELNQREISGDSYPYGLQLILSGLSTALHRGDPIELMNIDPVLEELRVEVQDARYIPNLVQSLLLDNPHRITLTLRPDTELAQKKLAAEKEQLAEIKASLSDDRIQEIVSRSRALAERQAQEDDPGLLPKVGLEDVPAELTEPERNDSVLSDNEIPLSYYAQGTNGLSYQQIVIELPELNPEQLEVLPLYTSCLPEFGIGNQDYAEVQTRQAMISGGVNCFSSIRSDRESEQVVKAFLTFSSKCLTRNHGALTALLGDTFNQVRFDEAQRLADLVEQLCARKENSITGSGHSLAMSLASSRLSPAARLHHEFGGLQGIKRLKGLRDGMGSDDLRNALLIKLQSIHQAISNAPLRFLLIGDEDSRTQMTADLEQYWQSATASDMGNGFSLPATREKVTEAWSTATQVNFCAKAYPTVAAAHPDNSTLHVLAGFLRNGFLHTAIREQGGAYGGGASQDPNSASFRFFSYRDPRLSETLNDFDRSIAWLLDTQHPDYRLEEAILGVIAAMDKSTSPAGEAKQAFYNHLFGRTLEQRMAFRRGVLETSMDDLRRVAETYFAPETASTGIISDKDSLQALDIENLVIENI
ncbi:MAG: insulinase family protein [Pseudomonadales bacterium]|nr:insulinase family protein [Pseudomonadales bacterium]